MAKNEHVQKSKAELGLETTDTLKALVEKDAWVSLKQYFSGKANGPEARVACVVISTLARERAAVNNARQLALLEKRFLLEAPRPESQS
jgi:hypothetical protein